MTEPKRLAEGVMLMGSISLEVARVCGAMLNRRVELEASIPDTDFTIEEIVRDITAYVKMKKLRIKKCMSQ